MPLAKCLWIPVFMCLVALPSVAHAHPHHAAGSSDGLAGGLLHPLMGIDHLLALLIVGVLAFQNRRRSLWRFPVAFCAAMALGVWSGHQFGGQGFSGQGWIEPCVSLTLVLLGVSLVVAPLRRLRWLTAIVFAAGALHGYAHGAEMTSAAGMQLYLCGVALSTAGLLCAGVATSSLATRGGHEVLLYRSASLLGVTAGFALVLAG